MGGPRPRAERARCRLVGVWHTHAVDLDPSPAIRFLFEGVADPVKKDRHERELLGQVTPASPGRATTAQRRTNQRFSSKKLTRTNANHTTGTCVVVTGRACRNSR
jgi:hypothetical protein